MSPSFSPCIERPGVDCLSALNLESAAVAAREVVRLALSGAARPLLTTSFGPGSAVLLHLVTREAPDIPVVWIDTGFNTRATLEFAAGLTARFGLKLNVYRPRAQWPGMTPELDDPVHAAFTEQVKLEPFARALAALQPDVWLSALRREQTGHRRAQSHFNRSRRDILKVHPLLHWSDADMAAYRARHDLPDETDYHDPTKAGPRRECGLHLAF